MSWLLDTMFGPGLKRETNRYITELASANKTSARRKTTELLGGFAHSNGPKVTLGSTDWKAPVEVPLSELVSAHSLVTGGTGSGKSMFALLMIKALIERAPGNIGFGVVDAKGELFLGALWLLHTRIHQLGAVDPEAAKALRRRITIVDFGSRDPISPYNLLADRSGSDAEFFALSRADLIMDLLGGGDQLSLGAVGVLQRILMLLAEFALPITWVDEVIRDAALRSQLLAESKNRSLNDYFAHHFEATPKSTLAAIVRRMEALTASESVRLALNAATAPDLRACQDESRIVLINCFGENIARSVRRLLQGLTISDIRQAVFARRNKENPFLWFCDEAQNFFTTQRLQENMNDLLTMSRSFGSFFLYLTQNMTTAVGDARMLKVLYTNVRWAFSMRGDPADCEFLAPALPVTGRKLKPRASPFEEAAFYTEREERGLLLDGASFLPDRTGYLWLKSRASEAIKLRTADLVMPHAQELETATQPIRRDVTVGWRISRKAYDRQIAERDQRWKGQPEPELVETLAAAYRKRRA